MTDKAKKIIEFTLRNEGYYVNDKDDSGGETYRGISRVNFPKWAGWAIEEE
jgi:lysozyme family protein